MTYILLFIALAGNPAFLGEFGSLTACKSAVREIYLTRGNPPGARMPEVERAVDLQLSVQRDYLCVAGKRPGIPQ